jgi:hypothetical protein
MDAGNGLVVPRLFFFKEFTNSVISGTKLPAYTYNSVCLVAELIRRWQRFRARLKNRVYTRRPTRWSNNGALIKHAEPQKAPPVLAASASHICIHEKALTETALLFIPERQGEARLQSLSYL